MAHTAYTARTAGLLGLWPGLRPLPLAVSCITKWSITYSYLFKVVNKDVNLAK